MPSWKNPQLRVPKVEEDSDDENEQGDGDKMEVPTNKQDGPAFTLPELKKTTGGAIREIKMPVLPLRSPFVEKAEQEIELLRSTDITARSVSKEQVNAMLAEDGPLVGKRGTRGAQRVYVNQNGAF